MIWPFGNKKNKTMSYVPRDGWLRVMEPFSGAWQRNIEWRRETVLANHAVFACQTLIASDISKLRIKLVKEDSNSIWVDVKTRSQSYDYSVLDKPNDWQNRIQFLENWVNSKLIRGNAYILKRRDPKNNKRITGLYVLCPDLVQVLVSDSGDIYYQLSQDNLTNVESSVVVPASEIIHDRFNCFYHPLVGLSPLYAAGLAAHMGLQQQENSAKFFANQSQPGGILTAPGHISDETAARLKATWQEAYTGINAGKVAVLGDDLKYTPLAMTMRESQMVEQMRLTSEIICSVYHVPKYKVIGEPPSYNNIEAMDQQYYSQCLQILLESIELCLDEGLEIPDGMGTEFDLDGLLRMDTNTQIKTLKEAVSGGISKPNEARRRLNMAPVTGGDAVYLQQQNYSLEALARRDAQPDPFAETQSATTRATQNDDGDPEMSDDVKTFALHFVKELQHA